MPRKRKTNPEPKKPSLAERRTAKKAEEASRIEGQAREKLRSEREAEGDATILRRFCSTIDADRLAVVTKLYPGKHDPGSEEMCVMEVVSFVTHEGWGDHPPCVCPVLGTFMRAWNDGISDDDERTALLLPFIPRLINTRGSEKVARRRATMAADWLIRVHTVAWLGLAKLDKHADLLASLPEITDFAQCPSLMPALTEVCNNTESAWDAASAAARAAASDAASATARDAAWAAARAAASDAASATAWDAASAAARAAASDAASAAAWDAASAAAWDAARAAARSALAKTKFNLQQSAVTLVDRMIAAT